VKTFKDNNREQLVQRIMDLLIEYDYYNVLDESSDINLLEAELYESTNSLIDDEKGIADICDYFTTLADDLEDYPVQKDILALLKDLKDYKVNKPDMTEEHEFELLR